MHAAVRIDSIGPGGSAAPLQPVHVTEWGLASGPSAAPHTVVRNGIEFECTRRNPDQADGAPPAGVREVRQFAYCRRPGTVGRSEETKFPLYMGLTWTLQLPNGWTIAAAQLRHRVPCWGYVFLVRLPTLHLLASGTCASGSHHVARSDCMHGRMHHTACGHAVMHEGFGVDVTCGLW